MPPGVTRMQENFKACELTAFLQDPHKCYFHSRSSMSYCLPVWAYLLTKLLDSSLRLCYVLPVLVSWILLCTCASHWRTHSCSARAKRTLFSAKSARILAHFICERTSRLDFVHKIWNVTRFLLSFHVDYEPHCIFEF